MITYLRRIRAKFELVHLVLAIPTLIAIIYSIAVAIFE